MDASVPIQSGALKSGADGSTLAESTLYQHDPLLVVLKDRFQLNMAVLVGGMFVLASGVFFGLEALAGTQFNLQGPGLLNLALSAMRALAFPFLFALYLIIPGSVADLFNTLQSNGAIGNRRADRPGTTEYPVFLKKLVLWGDSPIWALGTLVFIVLYWLYWLYLVSPQLSLPQSQTFPFWLRIAFLLIFTPVLYAVTMSIVRLLVALFFLNWLFHDFTIHINPLHPDGSGGLGILERMLTISVILMASLGLAALAMNSSFLLGNTNPLSIFEAVVLAIVYLTAGPVLLAGWLLLPHQVMQEACDAVLAPLADEFQKAIVDGTPLAKEDANAIKAGTERLSALKQRYDLLQDTFPVWPAEIGQIRRLTATLSIPFIIAFAKDTLIPLIIGIAAYFRK